MRLIRWLLCASPTIVHWTTIVVNDSGKTTRFSMNSFTHFTCCLAFTLSQSFIISVYLLEVCKKHFSITTTDTVLFHFSFFPSRMSCATHLNCIFGDWTAVSFDKCKWLDMNSETLRCRVWNQCHLANACNKRRPAQKPRGAHIWKPRSTNEFQIHRNDSLALCTARRVFIFEFRLTFPFLI